MYFGRNGCKHSPATERRTRSNVDWNIPTSIISWVEPLTRKSVLIVWLCFQKHFFSSSGKERKNLPTSNSHPPRFWQRGQIFPRHELGMGHEMDPESDVLPCGFSLEHGVILCSGLHGTSLIFASSSRELFAPQSDTPSSTITNPDHRHLSCESVAKINKHAIRVTPGTSSDPAPISSGGGQTGTKLVTECGFVSNGEENENVQRRNKQHTKGARSSGEGKRRTRKTIMACDFCRGTPAHFEVWCRSYKLYDARQEN